MTKTVLVTGGSGYLGKVLIGRLIKSGINVRAIARDEGKLIELKQLYPTVEILTGDIANEFDVHQAVQGVSGIYHLAASKHIGIAESQVRECILSNVTGTMNILDESLKNPRIEFVIGISTDKAAQVNGVYGASKFLMERLFEQYEKLNIGCSYRIVRYGNVLYSTGSVLCKWRDALVSKNFIIVTDLAATRFFWTVDQAVDLIFECMKNAKSSKPYIPKMKSMSILNLLIAMVEKYSPLTYPEVLKDYVTVIGLQPGENKHERMDSSGEDSSMVEKYTIEEIKQLI
jgi:UDP-N-acetylglucosamine 4,6-dehydratase/UDP-glucose 4-epimerase